MSTKKTIRVAAILEIPTPYRNPIFERINRSDKKDKDNNQRVKLDCFYLSSTQQDRSWEVKPLKRDVFLKARQFCIPGHHTFYFFADMKEVFKNDYDVFVIAGYAQPAMLRAIFHCWRKKIPYVIMTESHHGQKRSLLKTKIKSWLLRPIYKKSAANLVSGNRALDYVTSYKAKRDSCFFFPNAIDTTSFAAEVKSLKADKAILRSQWKIEQNEVVFLFVGSLVLRKGVDILLRSFLTLSQNEKQRCVLMIVGQGSYEESLKNFVKTQHMNDHVVFSGFVKPENLPHYYAMADIFILPSRQEPFGAVIMEAMSAGLPIITTEAVGAAGDYVKHGKNGLVVKTEDETGLTHAMSLLAHNPAQRKSMAQESEELSKPWSHEELKRNFISAVFHAYKSA